MFCKQMFTNHFFVRFKKSAVVTCKSKISASGLVNKCLLSQGPEYLTELFKDLIVRSGTRL